MANPNFETLRSEIKLKQPGRFYVFTGPEAYLRAHYLDLLHKLVVEDFAEAFNFHRFNAETLTPQALLDSIEAIPMMAPRSMVQIDDVNFFARGEDADAYAKILSDLPDYCTLVLVYETVEFKPDKRRKALAKAFEQALVVEFQKPTERELVTWTARHFKRLGKSLTPDLCVYLIRRTGGDMTTLLGEIEKLAAYAEDEQITKAQIDLLVEPVLEAVAYELSDAIAARRYDAAMGKLRDLLLMQEDPIKILGAISAQMRRILSAKRLRSAQKSVPDLMRLCGIQSYPAQKAMDYANRFSDRFCENAVLLCLEADEQMKTSYDEPERILELLVARLAREAADG